MLGLPRNPAPPPEIKRCLPALSIRYNANGVVTIAQYVLAEWYVGVDEHKPAAGRNHHNVT